MSKIKILHLLPSLEIGGMENALVNLINGMDATIFENAIFCFNSDNQANTLQERIIDKNIRIYHYKKREGVEYSLIIRTSRILKKEAADIIHTRNFAALLYGAAAAHLAGIHGVVADIRGCIPADQGLKSKKLSFLVSKFVAVSQGVKRLLANDYKIDEHKIKTIYNGVDFRHFRNSPEKAKYRAQIGLAPADWVIGSVGRLEPVKDYPTLLKAIAPLIQQHPPMKLILVGDGSQGPALKQLAQSLEITTNVKFLGYQQNILPFLKCMDVFALTSISEGLSNVLLEAMACSLPIVATDVGGNPEIVVEGESGFLVASGAVPALTEKIELLFRQPDLAKRMGQTGLQIVEQQFSIEKMVAGYQQLYIDLIQV